MQENAKIFVSSLRKRQAGLELYKIQDSLVLVGMSFNTNSMQIYNIKFCFPLRTNAFEADNPKSEP